MQQSFFQRRDPWGHGLAIWVLAGLLFLVPPLANSLRGMRMHNDVESWLPDGDADAQVYANFKHHFPQHDQLVVTWKGSTLDDPRTDLFCVGLLGKIDADNVRRGGVPFVSAVVTPRAILERMIRGGVEQDAAITSLRGTLIGTGSLKVRLTDNGRERQDRTVRDLVAAAKEKLGLDLRVHEAVTTFNADDTGSDEIVRTAAESNGEQVVTPALEDGDEPLSIELPIPAHDLEFSWPKMSAASPLAEQVQELIINFRGFATADEPEGRKLVDDAFFALGSPVALAVQLTEAGTADPAAALLAIREIAAKASIPAADLILAGQPVSKVELNRSVLGAAWNRSAPWWRLDQRSVMLFSGLVGIAIAIWFLGSVRLGLLVVSCSYFLSFVGTALIPMTGHTMNMVLLILPTLLMVVTLSGLIHVANFWKHASSTDPATAIPQAVKHAYLPCLYTVLTTVIGFLSLMMSNLAPVRQFGLFASIGTAMSLFMVLYGFPALLTLWPNWQVKINEADVRRWNWFSAFLVVHSRPIFCGTMIASLAATAGLFYFQTETKVIRNFAEDTEIVRNYRYLEQNLAGVTPVETVIRFNAAAQDQLRFLERLEIIREVERAIKNHSEISGTMSLAAFQPVREAPDADASKRDKVLYNRRSNETEKRIKNEIVAAKSYLTMADPTVAEDSPHPTFCAQGDELWRISAQALVLSDADYGKLTEDINQSIQGIARLHAGIGHVVTGAVPLFDKTQQALMESLVSSFGAASLIVCIALWLQVRNATAAILAMIPNVLPVTVAFGLVAWSGMRIDVGMMVTASVAFGMGVDGTLHLIAMIQESLGNGRSRERAIIESLSQCGPAIWQTSAALGLGLLVLYPAELLMVSRFGWLMALLIALSTLGNIVLLPVMLRGWLGACIEAHVRVVMLEKATLMSKLALEAQQVEEAQASLASDPPSINAPHIPLDKHRANRRRERDWDKNKSVPLERDSA